VLERSDDAEEAALHQLFAFLGGKRLLRYGYGTPAGVTDLDGLRETVGELRVALVEAISTLPARAPIAEWLEKLQEANFELLEYAYTAVNASKSSAPPPSEIAPAADQLREAYALVGARVDALYNLPTANHLTEQIRKDLQTRHEAPQAADFQANR
jgi:hypothetical protein